MRNIVLLFSLLGISIGWITGLSQTPIITVVLGSILSTLAAILGSLGSLTIKKEKTDKEIERIDTAGAQYARIMPIALIVIGMAVSAPIGVYIRHTQVLGTNQQKEMERAIENEKKYYDEQIAYWSDKTKVKPEEIAQGILNHRIKLLSEITPETGKGSAGKGVGVGLFGYSRTNCERLLPAAPKMLRPMMLTTDGYFKKMANAFDDEKILRKIVEVSCEQE